MTLVQVVGCLTLYLIFLHGIKMKIGIEYFSKICRENSSFIEV
jgi:hypothetical protein